MILVVWTRVTVNLRFDLLFGKQQIYRKVILDYLVVKRQTNHPQKTVTPDLHLA